MTAIVGLEHDGQVTIGGDSAVTDGWMRQEIRTNDKVWTSGDYVFGSAGSVRAKQLLQYAMPLPALDTWDVDAFMATRFIESLRTTLRDGGLASVSNNVERGGTFLVGLAGRLYNVGSDYQVGHASDGYAAIGCGEEYALGSMTTTEGLDLDADQRIVLALDAACHHSAGCAGPYTVVTGGAA